MPIFLKAMDTLQNHILGRSSYKTGSSLMKCLSNGVLPIHKEILEVNDDNTKLP